MKSLFTTKKESESNAIEIFFFFVLTNYIKRKKMIGNLIFLLSFLFLLVDFLLFSIRV